VSIKFFKITLPVRVVEDDPMRPVYEPRPECEDRILTVSVEMGRNATSRDAVEELARRLEKLCNDDPPYEGG
jgi:hypothetical protein